MNRDAFAYRGPDHYLTAQYDLERHLVVEAGAGAGKTFALSRRFANAILGGANPEQIVAVTFTRKAAAELKTRIRQTLQEYLAAGPTRPGDSIVEPLEDSEKEHLREAIARLPDAPVNTFHGFCGDLLRKFPVEAGVDPRFQLIEPAAMARRLKERADEFLENVLKRRDSASNVVRSLLEEYDFTEISLTFSEFRKQSKGTLDRWRQHSNDDKTLENELTLFFLRHPLTDWFAESCRTHAGDEKSGETVKAFEAFRANPCMESFMEFADTKSAGGISKDFTTWRRLMLGDKFPKTNDFSEAGKKSRIILGHFLKLAGIMEDEQGPTLSADELDYDALEGFTLKLLESPPGRDAVAQRMKLRHIMVDEYQDTNDVQRKIVLGLMGVDIGNRDAVGKPIFPKNSPRLFVVGDPKQAIYRFRGGEVEVFAKAKEDIARNSAADVPDNGAIALNRNYRSTPLLVRFFNRAFTDRPETDPDGPGAFSRISKEPAAYETNYSPMEHPDPQAECGTKVGWRIFRETPKHELASKTDLTPHDEHAIIEEQWITGQILDLRRKNKRFRDMVVLRYSVKSTTNLQNAFVKAGIPFYVVGLRNLLSRREIDDILQWLRLLAFPDDDLAVAACFKQPWIGGTDAMLLHIAKSDNDAIDWDTFASEQREKADSEDVRGFVDRGGLATRLKYGRLGKTEENDETNEVLQQFQKNLERLREIAGRIPVWELAAQIVTVNRMKEAWSAIRTHGEEETPRTAIRTIGNIERFLADLRRGYPMTADIADVLTTLEATMNEEESGAEAQMLAEDDDVVRIMTVHQAKGLEFPYVFAYSLNNIGRPGGDKAVVTDVEGYPVVRLRDETNRFDWGRSDFVSTFAKRIDTLKESSEKRRLFYVALTRAAKGLYVSGGYKLTKKEEEKGTDPQRTIYTANDGVRYLLSVFKTREEPDWGRYSHLPWGSEFEEFFWKGEDGDGRTEEPDSSKEIRTTARPVPPIILNGEWKHVAVVNPSRLIPEKTPETTKEWLSVVGRGTAGASSSAAKGADAVAYGDLLHRFMAEWDFRPESMETVVSILVGASFQNPDQPAKFLRSCVRKFQTLTWRPAGRPESENRLLVDVFRDANQRGCLHREIPFRHWRNGVHVSPASPENSVEWVVGTIDVLLCDGETRHVFDYKTGHQKPEHYMAQMNLYRDAVMAAEPGAPAPTVTLVYVE